MCNICSGRREALIQNEVTRLLRDEFEPKNLSIANAYREAISDEGNYELLTNLINHVHERIMQRGFGVAASKGCRSDGRPLNAIRPVSATTPIFPIRVFLTPWWVSCVDEAFWG